MVTWESASTPLQGSSRGKAVCSEKSYSAFVTIEQNESQSLSNRCCSPGRIIDPDTSAWLAVWDIVSTLLLLVTCVATPYEIAFLPPSVGPLFIFHRIVDAFFVIDMAMQFCISVPDPVCPTIKMRNPQRIMRSYLTGWFPIDLVSVMPFEMCAFAVGEQGEQGAKELLKIRSAGLARLAHNLRLLRLLRLTRCGRLAERWHTSSGLSYTTMSLVKFFGCVLLLCHFMACAWGGLGVRETEQITWLDALQHAKGGPPEVYEGPEQVYSLSLYWAVVTLTSIGYGDVTPQTSEEYWVCTLFACLGGLVWAYVIGAVCGILSSLAPHEMDFRRSIDDLNWLMQQNGVPHDMRKKLRRYLHETRDVARQRVEREVMERISPKLQGELAHFMHAAWISNVWYLKDMPPRILALLSRYLTPAAYSPNEEIAVADRTLCIIRRGICALKGRVMVSGNMWGEDMLLSNSRLRVKAAARSLSYVSLLLLQMRDLATTVMQCPEIRSRLRWAQVHLAMKRAVQMLSKTVKIYEEDGRVDFEGMEDGEREEFLVGILTGKYEARRSRESLPDIFAAEEEASRTAPSRSMSLAPTCRAASMVVSRKSTRRTLHTQDSGFEEIDEKLDTLTRQIDVLTNQITTLQYGALAVPHRPEFERAESDLGPLVFKQVALSANAGTAEFF